MYKDLTEIDAGVEYYVAGEAQFEPGEYETGTADGWTANVYGLNICVNGKEYYISHKVMTPELVEALEKASETELNKYY